MSSAQPGWGSRKMQPRNSGRTTATVSRRCLSIPRGADAGGLATAGSARFPNGFTHGIIGCGFDAELLAGAAEPAFPVAVGIDGAGQRLCVEIRPQLVGEVELRISQLPQKEIADALLA